MAEGHNFKGYLPGGASGGILPASMADIPLDFGTLEAEGCFIGSAAVVVLSDQDDMKAVALNLLRFFEDESCGQCTPCRVGTEKAVKLMSRAAMGRRSAAGVDAGDGRRVDLRPGSGGDEPGEAGAEAFPRGFEMTASNRSPRFRLTPSLAEELAREDAVEMANLTTAQTGVSGTIFISTAMGAHGPRVKYFVQPGRTQPSFSVSIADAPPSSPTACRRGSCARCRRK